MSYTDIELDSMTKEVWLRMTTAEKEEWKDYWWNKHRMLSFECDRCGFPIVFAGGLCEVCDT